MATDTTVHSVNPNDGTWKGGGEPFKASYGKLMMWYFLVSDAFTFAGFLIAYGALRLSMPSWPVPDFVFSSFPGLEGSHPLLFVTLMTFILLFSSFTMVRAVQEGHRENKKGVAFWLFLTVIGGAGFLGCQAWEWNKLIGEEHMTIHTNPFGTHVENGKYLEGNGHGINEGDLFHAGDTYLIHKHGDEYQQLKYQVSEGADAGKIKELEFGPKQFGALFFFITGFHGFHVFSGVMILLIVLANVLSNVYVERRNGYEMVEKVGLYWHFVDLVWVFVFLCFYLL
ncbi:MAG: cytochrome c oxidase subunit 3 [Saprospiraceae bacterium]|nr:cytochrome c oxidase subunit 3 [Saprospiraceae bacterium]MCB9328720.1 cytochrome c oxidase subunit 3 [Lewinellaceae bacterium]